MNIGFIGPGRVGTGLARLLADRGYAVSAVAGRSAAVADRSAAHAAALADALPHCRAVQPQAVADTCDLVFITTPDSAIAHVASALTWRRGQGVVHCSGALPAAALAVVERYGAVPGGFHPLQALPDAEAAFANLPGSFIAVDAAEPLLGQLTGIAAALGCMWGYVPPEARPAYHAAAVLVFNYTVVLAHAGQDIWRALGKTEAEATQALLPLLRGTVDNIRRLGPRASLTGPAARGDWTTVAGNLQAITDTAPQHAYTYAALALAMVYNNLAPAGANGAALDTGDGPPSQDPPSATAVGNAPIESTLRSLVGAALRNRGRL